MNSAADLEAAARTIGALIVVLAIAYGLARITRRSTSRSAGRGVRVVDRLALTRDASLAVVQVGGRGLVLGITSQSVNVLGEIEPAVLLQQYRAPKPAAARTSHPVVVTPEHKRKTNGSVLDPATWSQAVETIRDLTVRRS